MPFTAFAPLMAWCVVLTVIDIRQQKLPNVLTGSGAVIIFGYALFTTQFTASLLGALLLAVPYLLVHLAAPASFGAGDVKLAIGLGAAAALGGARVWVWAAIAAPMLTALAGMVLLALRWRNAGRDGVRRHTIAHGPSMCAATVLALAL